MVSDDAAVGALESRCRAEFQRLEGRINKVCELANVNKLEAEAVAGENTNKLADVTRRFDNYIAQLKRDQALFEKEARLMLRPWYVKLYQWLLPRTS
jgi:hypothetical protein